MTDTIDRAIAIVGVGSILPDAPDTQAFWSNLQAGRYSISEVPADRWNMASYYDADPHSPLDKTYSKIGGWVREYAWDPARWKLPIPPKVGDAMDAGQKWAVACTREALLDFGYPDRPLDRARTAVILGNAMAGEKHYLTALRVLFPEFAHALSTAPSFAALDPRLRQAIEAESRAMLGAALPPVTEDTMPGELSNCIAGRIANLFDLHGPNYVVDAACASAMAAMSAAIEGLIEHDYDAVLTGGIDRNMGPSSFVKFCKIGALSATGTRPYADGADGFVMGEGAVVLLLKRLADAERANDRIYAVVRGVGGSSDGKGKGLTAPNPTGQKLAVERAWDNAGLSPETASLVEGHGTSTRVGDVVEVEALSDVLRAAGAPLHSIALGSVKSNLGHLKAAAGAAGLLKVALALRYKTLPPSLGFTRPNPNIDFEHSPLAVNTALRPWSEPSCGVRRAGVSAFGFGGTNFHAVLEEHVPGALTKSRVTTSFGAATSTKAARIASAAAARSPLRGALVLGAASLPALAERLASVQRAAATGHAPAVAPPARSDLEAPERIAIDFGDAAELADKAGKAQKALRSNDPAAWRMLRQQGVFAGRGPRGKLAFLYTGQGSQYVNMLAALRASEPIVAETFAEADRVMTPLLGGRTLSSYIFTDANDPVARAQAEQDLKQTAITQPALLATDTAIARLLAAYGVRPDLVMGHSLGEYGALVAAGVLPFADALDAVSARGREMSNLAVVDQGWMVAVTAPLAEIEAVVTATEGYAVIANVNSPRQSVIGGASAAVEQAMQTLVARGYQCVRLPVSHAFHTQIVAPASAPLRSVLERLDVRPPRVPVVANVTGALYPSGEHARPEIIDLLARQVAAPVQFLKGLETLYAEGVRVFVEVGPKRALAGLADDSLGHHPDVMTVSTNHPKLGDAVAFNQALCGLYAAGFGAVETALAPAILTQPSVVATTPPQTVVITGAALGLPGTPRVFDDANIARLLRGESLIDVVPARHRRAMVDKHITRVVKGDDGSASFQLIDDPDDVIRLAGRGGTLDLEAEFGVSAERLAALDVVTRLAIGAGLDALRDAGIPLVRHYKPTSKGTQLPDRWALPSALRDDTGVIFASAFPGLDAFADELARYHADVGRRDKLVLLDKVIAHLGASPDPQLRAELVYQRDELRAEQDRDAYQFDRRFLFRVLAMGHSQFAELIGARGPNTQINAACASTTQAVAIAEDWIRAGRCRRVIVIAGDDVTSDHLIEWMGAGFLSSGAAATDDVVEKAALPFDRRRHGMIMGMGAAAIVVESPASARERGLDPIAEVLGTVTANSAFHGTRLDLDHIGQVMELVVRNAEASAGVARTAMAAEMVFVSHETYTPARGGSASAEIHALREVFGDAASHIVIANTKGMTGHSMAVGLEDVIAIKALETGVIPPIPNHKEVDPELGSLNLSHGGPYPIRYALRLGAGFGSQISMSLLRWVPTPDGRRHPVATLGYDYRVRDRATWDAWLARVAGVAAPQLEVVKRTLRVKDQGPSRLAAPTPRPAVIVPPPPPALQPTRTPPLSAPAPVDAVKHKVMSIVATTTGYPPDMLDETLDLEADLGVDTVKQAETFAAVRAAYDIPRQDDLKLRDFPTLAHVVQFVYTHRPDLARPAAPAASSEPVATPAPAAVVGSPAPPAPPAPVDAVKHKVMSIVATTTGYPPDMLDETLDLEADLGVDTVKQAETFAAVRAAYDIPRQDDLKLRDFPTLAHVVQFVYTHRPDLRPAPSSPAVVQPAPAALAPAAPAMITTPATAPVTAARADDLVKARVLAIIADKTGYPPDMLDEGLDLEADLGVDTVKQAETFAAVRAAYAIPRQDDLKLRDFPTIAHVVQFVYTHRPDLAPGAAIPLPPDAARPVTPRSPPALVTVDANFPRRVPMPVLRPPLELCKPTGVTLARGSRVLILRDLGGVADALAARLAARGVETIVGNAGWSSGDLLQRLHDAGTITGVYWLAALDDEGDLRKLELAGFRDALRLRVKRLAGVARALYETLAHPGTFVVGATRLGGAHGYDAAGATAPLGGAVTGFIKALAREREAALCKAVDFAADATPESVAEVLIAETLADPGAVEIGAVNMRRVAIGLVESPLDPSVAPSYALSPASHVVVTGAAGSIVAAITADLAAHAGGGTFHLLDLAPAPDPDDRDLQWFERDRDGLKRDLFERLKARGERATPAMIERELAVLERKAAAQTAITAITRAGGTAHYHQVDLGDGAAVATAMAAARATGRLDLLVHAAGVEISHLLPDKPDTEIDRVFDVKADGWFNLLAGLGDAALGAVVVFGSIAGRFGNAGQTDYSAANDLLCKLVSNLRRTRPEARGVAVDWTAWGGIGMASRGSIPKLMELAGIDMLPPAIGIPIVHAELARGGGEVVVAGRLGALVRERDPDGGLDLARVSAMRHGPMIGRITGMGLYAPLVAETTLDPAREPFLDHHRIAGTAVLPGVMGIEGFAELATSVVPGARIVAVEQVRFEAAFKFYRDEPRALRLEAWLRPEGDQIVAECRLVGVRRLVGRDEPQLTTHFTGRARLTTSEAWPVVAPTDRRPATSGAPAIEAAEIYEIYFHGPTYQVLDAVWAHDGAALGRMAEHLPPDVNDGATLLDPRRIELCFQTAGIWDMREHGGRMALPRGVDELRWIGPPPSGPVAARVVVRDDGGFDADVADAQGAPYLLLRGYRTIAVDPGEAA
jgi:acyl transferase domain-containing protein/NAD(P)-dependent dehydrogenase (short-subunit alcohol dehydrogenase family)/acyl carrier protein